MIYAVQPTAGGPVKIGTTEDLTARLAQLEAHYRQPLAVLATLPGSYAEERALHERFAHLRFGRTEQFRPSAELMAFLGRPLLVGANPGAVEAIPVAMRNIRITPDVRALARMAAAFNGEGVHAYVERVVRAQATADLDRHTRNWQATEGKKATSAQEQPEADQ